jgi:DNA-binding MurR/RpiR family transcriptional regulator
MLRIIIIFIISSFVSFADDYTVTRHVFGSGGATVSNSNYSMSGTVGQSAIGISFSPDNRIIHGFWTAQSIADIQIIALTQGWNT